MLSVSSAKQGLLCGFGAFLLWGIFPIYFKWLGAVPPYRILSHRILWSAVFTVLLLTLGGNWRRVVRVLQDRRRVVLLGITGILVGCNWFIYIWAVNNDHVLDASLGYFLMPLVTICFGVIFFRERMRPLQIFAVSLAVCGVLIQFWMAGSVPVVALGLALTFASYGLLRKKMAVDSQSGMLLETVWLLPFALCFLYFSSGSNVTEPVSAVWLQPLLLMGTGVITTVPLLLYNTAAIHLRMATLGFMQYISPCMVFLLGAFVYGETLGVGRVVSFALIWAALLLFTMDGLRARRRRV